MDTFLGDRVEQLDSVSPVEDSCCFKQHNLRLRHLIMFITDHQQCLVINLTNINGEPLTNPVPNLSVATVDQFHIILGAFMIFK